jgi:ribonuclease R
MPLAKGARGGADVGDLVILRLRGRGAEVREVLGRASSAPVALGALLLSEGLGRPFPAAVLAEAEEAAAEAETLDPGRRDLTAQRVVTIDPEGAKDHDDALAVRAEGDAVRLWVHIADVARFVPAGGSVDREAGRRLTSVYVPGMVDPMLPPRLSNDVCSLRPGVPRKVVTVDLLIDAAGEVLESSFARSLIRSDRRLTYPEVDALFAGAGLGEAGLESDLALLREVADRLLARRRARGALEIATPEPAFRFEGDRVAAASLERQTASHSLVEECMIGANEAVARYLIARSRPTVFRFHEDPAPPSVERLYDQLDALGVAAPPLPEGPLTPSQCAAAVREAARAVSRHIARTGHGEQALPGLVLRALRQARYSPNQVGHSGLASPAYLHFTSPIRRYPDLLAHRSLLDALGLGDPGPDPAWLAEAADAASAAERAAAALEHRANRLCATYLLRDDLARAGRDRAFQGEITGVVAAGCFVAFGGGVYEGFLPARRIEGDHFHLDPLEVALVGAATGRRLRLGDPIEVRVSSTEPLRGRVDLEPAAGSRPPRRARPRMAGRGRR